MPDPASRQTRPRITRLGLTGLLVQFADRLSDPANRGALALREAVESAAWPGVAETAPSLAALFVRVDPRLADPAEIETKLRSLTAERDWTAEPLPTNRRLWRIPCSFGGAAGPQLGEAAALAGVGERDAIAQLSEAPLRVLALGFAPGQPYLGTLPKKWDIPRQTALTRAVPTGALVIALRQLIIFTAPSPTGWRQIGQTAFRGFRPHDEPPILLRAGDEVQLIPVEPEALAMQEPPGGQCEPLP